MNPRTICISDYDYALPDERIAKFPLAQRDHSKLLVYNKGRVGEDIFQNLPQHLPEGALMVFNNTRVIQARLHFRKEPTPQKPQTSNLKLQTSNLKPQTSNCPGALIEVFLLEPACPRDYEQMFQQRGHCSWYCIIGNLKKWKQGSLTRTITVNQEQITVSATRLGQHGASHLVQFQWQKEAPTLLEGDEGGLSFAELIDAIGELPIPPYLNRATQESDKQTYQTVYSKIKGSVAAPTAGLHFTPEVLSALDAKGIDREELTLHVGAGTFKPVKSEQIEGHEMHTEYIAVRRQTVEKLLRHDCRAIAVGTTSVRTLESLYWMGLKLLCQPALTGEQLHVTQWEPYDQITTEPLPSTQKALQALLDWMADNHLDVLHSSTQIIIAPGYDYKVVNMLVTNFHQPKSTLLLLVSAFVHGDWRRIYDYALQHDFRFLSYGDSNLLIP